MSTKTVSVSSTSMRNARRRTPKTRQTRPVLVPSLTVSGLEVVASSRSSSPLRERYSSPAFQLEWDNDVATRVAIGLAHLRRYRKHSQVRVAKAMRTSQSKVATLESGDANITLKTLRKAIDALRGRLRLAIEPEELSLPSLPQWWEMVDAGMGIDGDVWTLKGVRIEGVNPPQWAAAVWGTSDRPKNEFSQKLLGEADDSIVAAPNQLT